MSIAIEGGGMEFQLYSSSVFYERRGTTLDHGVIVVGYGTKNVHVYWIVRNYGVLTRERNDTSDWKEI